MKDKNLSEDEIFLYQHLEKFVAENDGELPNISQLSKLTGFSTSKTKRIMESLESKDIIKIKKEGNQKKGEILRYIIPAFAGATGMFVGFKILTESQMKKAVKEQAAEQPVTVVSATGDAGEMKQPEYLPAITIPENQQPSVGRDIIYIPTESGGYQPAPVSVTYQPAPIDFGEKTVNVYGGGGSGGEDFSELWQQLLTIIGDQNCAQQYKGNVESGVMSLQEVYQICAQEGANVEVESDVGSLRKWTCNMQNCYWDSTSDVCDCSKDKFGKAKTSTSYSDIITPPPADTTPDGSEGGEQPEGYDPFGGWKEKYGSEEPEGTPKVGAYRPDEKFEPVFSPFQKKVTDRSQCAGKSQGECVSPCFWNFISQTCN